MVNPPSMENAPPPSETVEVANGTGAATLDQLLTYYSTLPRERQEQFKLILNGDAAKEWGIPESHDVADKKATARRARIRGRGGFRQVAPLGRVGYAANGTADGESEDDEQEDGKDKPRRVRASKLEYWRLDELWDESIHGYKLSETKKANDGKDDKWEEYVFIVRRQFGRVLVGSGVADFTVAGIWGNQYKGTSVDIKSVDLRNALREVFKDVQAIHSGLREDKPGIDPNHLFNFLPEISKFLQTAKAEPEATRNSTLVQHLELLVDYVNTDYEATMKRLFPLLQHCEISFDLLWALFLPNTLVYTICPGSKEARIYKVDWTSYQKAMNRGKFFKIDCHYIDFDGKSFIRANACLEIDDFPNPRDITSLHVFPLAYHDDEAAIREELVERGKKFGGLKGMHYKMYDGLAFYKKKKAIVRLNVNGRIMVDPTAFRRLNANYLMNPAQEGLNKMVQSMMDDDDDDDDDGCGGDGDDDDEEVEDINSTPALRDSSKAKSAGKSRALIRQAMRAGERPQRAYVLSPDGKINLVTPASLSQRVTAVKKEDQAAKEGLTPETMTEEELLLCSPTVLGFSFADKIWAEFAVAHISEIEFNPDAFESLVLPENQKKIVKALVESHSGRSGQTEGIDDVIKGKGKGLVAVLHGRPGVGKTLTAEGISEYLKRPLYMVGAGELGTDPRVLEQSLSRIFDLGHCWKAIVLLDEADVFLERRSTGEIHRNALVSIFLRQLEYFQGILFLTTNRVETFDDAFQSRIHIGLRYNDLNKKAMRAIWRTFLKKVAESECKPPGSNLPNGQPHPQKLRQIVTEDDLDRLTCRDLNGRQIKNVVTTSQKVAQNMAEPLSMKHIREVLDATQDFEKDMKGTGQLDGMMSYA